MLINPTKAPPGAINSVANLSDALDIPLPILERLAEDFEGRYQEIGKPATRYRRERIVYNPHDELKAVQKTINSRLFHQVQFGSYLFGGIFDPDSPRDYIYCAGEHCPAGVLAKVDIKRFFDSTLFWHIEKIFLDFFHYDPQVSRLLTNLTTIHRYNLPQGAPTSVALANLVFHEEEPKLANILANRGVRYTRFIDDIVISHPDASADIDTPRIMVENMIKRCGYELNKDKSVNRCRATNTIEVFGIRVNGKHPRLTKKKHRNIRAAVHQLECQAAIPNERKSQRYTKQWHHVSGLLAKLKRTNHPKYKRYRRRMRRIMPLMHERKLNAIKARVRRLVSDSNQPKKPVALKHRHDILANEVGIVGRTHEKLATKLRLQLLQAKRNIEKAKRNNDAA